MVERGFFVVEKHLGIFAGGTAAGEVMALRIRTRFAVLAAAAVVLAACGQVGGYKESPENAYDDDGRLGATETNPNLPTSPTYHNYREDHQVIRQTLDKFPEVRDARVVLNGPTAVIYYRVPDTFSRKQVEQLEERVVDALTYTVPRYDFVMRCRNKPE